jgi:hypothetical protein
MFFDLLREIAMAYSIYFYIDPQFVDNPPPDLAESLIYKRVVELRFGKPANTEDPDRGFGWFKPRSVQDVKEVVGWLEGVRLFLKEIADDNYPNNPFHKLFLELIQQNNLAELLDHA